MLVLPIQTHGSLIALADDAVPGQFSVATAKPKLAQEPDGKPLLRLDRWVLPAGGSGPEPKLGGRLNLTVQLTPSRDEITAANLDPSRVQPIAWLNASVELRGPLFEPLEVQVAIAPDVSGKGPRGVIIADLSPQSASVLASLLTRESVSPLQVIWTGTVLVRLPSVEIIASASVNRSAFSLTSNRGFERRRTARLLIESNARVEIRGANNPELEAAFRDWALGELTRSLDEGRELSVRASAAQVVPWKIQLATTLDGLLVDGRPGELVYLHVIDPAELGSPPPLEVRVLGAFGETLERVDVRLTPAGLEAREISILSDTPQGISLGTADFTWSYRAKTTLQPAGEWSAAQQSANTYSLLISIPLAVDLRIEVLASGLDFENRWSSVRVQLTHRGTSQDSASTVLELDSAHHSALWKSRLSGPRGSISAKLTFLSKQGVPLEVDAGDVTGEQLLIEDPLHAYSRHLALLPAGTGWAGIAVAMIDLRYRDGGFHKEETVELVRFDSLAEWTVPMRPGASRAIDWRCHASFQDGRFEQTQWQSTDSDVLAVVLQAPEVRRVEFVPVFFNASRTPRADIRILSGETQVMVAIESTAAVSVTLPRGPFRWLVTWKMVTGPAKESAEQTSDEDVIVLPRAPA